jgi:hypothetical protein
MFALIVAAFGPIRAAGKKEKPAGLCKRYEIETIRSPSHGLFSFDETPLAQAREPSAIIAHVECFRNRRAEAELKCILCRPRESRSS